MIVIFCNVYILLKKKLFKKKKNQTCNLKGVGF